MTTTEDELRAENAKLRAACEKIVAWLDRLASKAESSAKTCSYTSLKEAYVADAKNYRATAADVRKAVG